MNARNAVLLVAFLFIVGFGYLTLAVVASHGVDVLTVAALVVLALFAFGIVGALRNPPDE